MLVMPSVTVVSGGVSVSVEVRQLPQCRLDGFACLADIWRSARLPGALPELAFDFVGGDGFRLSKKYAARLGGIALSRGFVDRRSRDLVWDEALELPCFFKVKGLVAIVAESCAERVAGFPPPGEAAQACACKRQVRYG